jgi:hypothetical protein
MWYSYHVILQERLALEHFEDQVEDAWRRTRVARSLCVKGVAGSALLFTGAHFSRCVVLAHTLRGATFLDVVYIYN